MCGNNVPYLIGFAAECLWADELTVEMVSHIYIHVPVCMLVFDFFVLHIE